MSEARELQAVNAVMSMFHAMLQNPRVLDRLHEEGFSFLTETYLFDITAWINDEFPEN